MEHCRADGESSLAKLEELRDELRVVRRWSGGGKELILYVHPARRDGLRELDPRAER